ncbi:hypothetical protein, partial [Geminocystis sp. GBBB08]|uniref:hypothetical protein n=1 Tax=Geminocystis sp. GBBB08 TaxID=2604140 RepID=UPI0027E217E9
AKYLGYDLPVHKLRYIVTGESFPENFRINLQNQAQVSPEKPFLYSFYGSADTGILGTESLASICLRKILYQNPVVASRLGFNNSIPDFFHFTPKDAFLETHEKGILVTEWQETPLFRYLLADKVSFYSWQDLKQKLISASANENICPQLLDVINNSSDYFPDIIALTGRTDTTIILLGGNFSQYLLEEIIKHEDLQHILTGIYYAQ